ncbi:type II secretion system protein [bacterium]|nr:type II secretion system protein [bacterium]
MMNNKIAFTLAEVLITLGIIGVVAAVTLPTLTTNITERKNSERHANIAFKITQAMEMMRSHGELVKYDSTEDFITHLQKYLKIAKICYKDNIAECWPTSTVLDRNGEEFEISKAKTGKNLNLGTTSNNVGLILADGASLILNYDPSSEGLDIGDEVRAEKRELPVGFGKTKDFPYTTSVTGAIDFVTDVNGGGKPNREKDNTTNKENDIRSFNGASFTLGCPGEDGPAGCLLYLGTSYSPVNCTDTSSEGYAYCEPTPSNRSLDYWAGAKYECAKRGMRIPNVDKLQSIQTNKSHYLSLNNVNDWSWTSDEYSSDSKCCANGVRLSNGANVYCEKDVQAPIICVSN